MNENFYMLLLLILVILLIISITRPQKTDQIKYDRHHYHYHSGSDSNVDNNDYILKTALANRNFNIDNDYWRRTYYSRPRYHF